MSDQVKKAEYELALLNNKLNELTVRKFLKQPYSEAKLKTVIHMIEIRRQIIRRGINAK